MNSCARGEERSTHHGSRGQRAPRRPARRLLLPAMGVLLCVVLLAAPAIAAAAPEPGVPSPNPAWSWISPTQGGDNVGQVSFADADHGWAVGPFKGVLFTADGGVTWQANRFGPPLGSLGVHFADTQHGWAVGQGSDSWDFDSDREFICATSDGGVTWEVQLYAERPLPGLDCVYVAPDLQTGYAAGRASTLYRTTDGGQNWTKVEDLPIPEDLVYAVDFLDMQWLSPEVGILYGSGPSSGGSAEQLLLVTKDGGATWALKYLPEAGGGVEPLWRMCFADPQHGFAVGWGGQVWGTENGGDDWTEKSPTSFAIEEIRNVYFDDADHGWIVGNAGQVASTTDGGDSWTLSDSGIPVGLNTIDRLSATTLIAMGDIGFGLLSKDNGRTWHPIGNGLWQPESRHVSFPSEEDGWIAGDDGALFHTHDGGAHWEPVDLGTAEDLTGLQFLSTQQGWVLDAGGTVRRTLNGGRTWQAFDTGAEVRLNNLLLIDREHGWAVGEDGAVVATIDGGETWVTQPTGLDEVKLTTLFFLDHQHGWIAGAKPGEDETSQSWVARTADGGLTWTASTFTSLPNSSVFSMFFLDQKKGFAAGWASVAEGGLTGLFETTDAGATWTYVPMMPLPLQPLFTLDFTSPTDGVALGGYGIAYSTDDGGRTWIPNMRFCPTDAVQATHFPGALSQIRSTGYALTSMGAVARTTVGGAELRKLTLPLDATQRPENVEITLTNTDQWFHDFYLVGLNQEGRPVWDDRIGVVSGKNLWTAAGDRWSLTLEDLFPNCGETLHILLLYTGEDIDPAGICEVSIAYHWSDIDADVLAPYQLSEAQLKAVSQGYPDGSWQPYATMTRAQFVKMAVTAFGITPLSPATPTFTDVPTYHPFYSYVEGAVAAGLIKGTGGNAFSPYAPVTREQGAAVIARHKATQEGVDLHSRYTGTSAPAVLAPFADSGAVSPVLLRELAYAVDEGIMTGAGGLLNPADVLTRIQGAAMIVRAGDTSSER